MASAGGAELHSLPPVPAGLAGETRETHHKYTICVSNAHGYLCRVNVRAKFDVSPDVIFALFTHPDNSSAFRDVKRIANREILEERRGYKRVKVEQQGEFKIMWMKKVFSTLLEVEEDATNPELLTTQFTLLKSDVVAKFHGMWKLRPVQDPITGKITTDAELEQDVLPKGVPTFLRGVPVLGGLLRGASTGVIKRLLEDIYAFVDKVKAGVSIGQLLGAHQTDDAILSSFAVDDDAADEEAVENVDGEWAVKVLLSVLPDGSIDLEISPRTSLVHVGLDVKDDGVVQVALRPV